MALVSSGFEATVVLGTKNDKTRTIRLKHKASITTYAAAVTAVTDFLTTLAAVCAGVVKSYTITSRAIEDAYNRPTDTDAEGRDTAQVIVGVEDEPLKRANVLIPMPKIGIFSATAGTLMDVIDIADADLIAYIENFRTTGDFTISDGENADAIIYEGKRLK